MKKSKFFYGTSGDWNVYCDRCGFKYPRSQCAYEHSFGNRTYLVCLVRCWEKQHPQEFVRGIPDRQFVPDVRSRDGSETLPLQDPPYNGTVPPGGDD
jgi:hypothetical protein